MTDESTPRTAGETLEECLQLLTRTAFRADELAAIATLRDALARLERENARLTVENRRLSDQIQIDAPAIGLARLHLGKGDAVRAKEVLDQAVAKHRALTNTEADDGK